MKLSEFKKIIKDLTITSFQLPDGRLVPSHFHVTEVGKISKHFIDCGGVVRNEEIVNFQLWNADDYEHQLAPETLLNIINLSEKVLGLEDLEIEVEYQGTSIQKFGLGFDGSNFQLTSKHTDCLAKDNCGIPKEKKRVKLSALSNAPSCSPNSNCC